MNLVKLFESQQKLDDHIEAEHQELRDQDNMDWKILALQVELGECANEWRGFKKWSANQEPVVLRARNPYMDLDDADFYNPLLEEYVDCLHFILTIGNESAEEWLVDIEYLSGEFNRPADSEDITEQFNYLFRLVSNFWIGRYPSTYIDLVNEFLCLGEMFGFTWDEVEAAYFSKNKINHARQEDGY